MTVEQPMTEQRPMMEYRRIVANIFSFSFHGIALMLMGIALHQFLTLPGTASSELMATFIKAINALVIALAMYELGTGVAREYAAEQSPEQDILGSVRNAVTRFVGTVVIALVLESLIMIIKYSQLDLAGNLVYPMGMIVATAALLVCLGGFLRLTSNQRVATATAAAATWDATSAPVEREAGGGQSSA